MRRPIRTTRRARPSSKSMASDSPHPRRASAARWRKCRGRRKGLTTRRRSRVGASRRARSTRWRRPARSERAMSLPGTEDRRRIYLMRHGHVDYFARHIVESGASHAVTLTVRGRSEAEAAGRAFSHIRFDRAVCSGLPRTKETAEAVLASVPNAPPLEIDSDLVEIRGGKIPEVKSRAELIRMMNVYFARAHEPGATNHEGGEVFAEAQARAVNAIERLLGTDDWHTALVVAHEGINRLILSWACDAGLRA